VQEDTDEGICGGGSEAQEAPQCKDEASSDGNPVPSFRAGGARGGRTCGVAGQGTQAAPEWADDEGGHMECARPRQCGQAGAGAGDGMARRRPVGGLAGDQAVHGRRRRAVQASGAQELGGVWQRRRAEGRRGRASWCGVAGQEEVAGRAEGVRRDCGWPCAGVGICAGAAQGVPGQRLLACAQRGPLRRGHREADVCAAGARRSGVVGGGGRRLEWPGRGGQGSTGDGQRPRAMRAMRHGHLPQDHV